MNDFEECLWLDDTEYDPRIDVSKLMDEAERDAIRKKALEELKKTNQNNL